MFLCSVSLKTSHHIFTSEEQYWFGFGRISQAFLNWDKVISWSQPGSGDGDVSCTSHSYNSHRYFSPCLKDGTSNLLYCSNWCYCEKLFLPEPAILQEGYWHLTRNVWLSKCCYSTPISISERIKIDFKKTSRFVSSANHTDSPKRCYVPQLISHQIKPFLLKKQHQFKACIMSLPTAVNTRSFWIYAKHILLHHLLFRQAPLLSQKYSYYNHLFLHPTADLLTCPLKSKPRNVTQTTAESSANLIQHTANLAFSSCCHSCSLPSF